MLQSNGHSVKPPRLYKTAAKILKLNGTIGGIKNAVCSLRFGNIPAVYALVNESVKYNHILTSILDSTNILNIEQGLDPWLAKVLITELLFGKKRLPEGNKSKPVLTILKYKEDILKQLKVVDVNNISSSSEKNRKASRNMPSTTSTIGYLFLYSMAMFSLPFVAFFGVRITLRDYFGIDGFINTAWSVIASVLVVNTIIFCYVIKAWHEPDPERQDVSSNVRKED